MSEGNEQVMRFNQLRNRLDRAIKANGETMILKQLQDALEWAYFNQTNNLMGRFLCEMLVSKCEGEAQARIWFKERTHQCTQIKKHNESLLELLQEASTELKNCREQLEKLVK